MNDIDDHRDRLIEVLTSLEYLIKKQVSLKLAFMRGAIYGVGTIIGATVVLSIMSYILLNIFGVDLGDLQFFVNSSV